MKHDDHFDYVLRKGQRRDIPQLVDLGARFFGESNQLGGATMSREKYQRTLETFINHDLVAAIVADVDGEIVGYVHIYAQDDATVELIGDLYQFYVIPEYRGTGVSRELAKAAVSQYAEWNCKAAYIEAAPGMADPHHLQLFENLWGRVGFKKIGLVMCKEF